MGVLKVRSNGQWINVGVGGGPLPAGGVLGDILVKRSANPSDALWGTTMPKLTLTSDGHATNPALTLAPSTHATSERAAIWFGDWMVGQDLQANGGKDFFIWKGGTAIGINAAVDRVSVPATVAFPAGGWIDNVTTELRLFGSPQVNLFGDKIGGLNAVGNAWLFQHDGTNFNLHKGSLAVLAGDVTASGQVYCGSAQWFRVRGGGSGLYWEDYGGGIYMQDSTWVRVYGSKWFWANGVIQSDAGGFRYGGAAGYMLTHGSDTDSGLYWRSDNAVALMSGGNFRVDVGASVFIKNDTFTTGNKNWAAAQLISQNVAAAGNVAMAGIAFNPANSGVAPIWLCNGSSGEILVANNNPNTGYIPIIASAFNVGSSERFKVDIEALGDRDVLDKVRRVELIRYRERIRPQNTFGPDEHHDHDCAIDPCDGTPDDPCCIALNDKPRLGVSAEQLWQVLPEVVHLGNDRKPHAVSIGQLAALALAGVAALTRRIEQLEGQAAA